MNEVKGRIKVPEGRKIRSVIAILVVMLVMIAAFGPTAVQDKSIQYNLKDQTELEYLEDNVLGTAIIRTGSSIPALVKEPKLEACIYSRKNNSPVILPVDTTDVLISTDRLETIEIKLSIPRDKIDREYPKGEINLTMQDRCPLRSSQQIVLTER